MSRIKVVRTDKELYLPTTVNWLNRLEDVELVELCESISEDELAAEVKDATILLTCYGKITEKVISNSNKLKAIVKYGVGVDAIDIEAAKKSDVVVVNVPEYAEETVAEGAFALMISLAKKLNELRDVMTSKAWAWPQPQWLAMDLSNKIIALVGCGRIGTAMARMANGFNMHVIAYDPYVSVERMKQLNVKKYDSLDDMIKQCDFLSIHTILSNETKHLIGKHELSLLKKESIVINVSRGEIVDEKELVSLLINDKIAGAGIDVFSNEPITVTNHLYSPLLNKPNVILTPHLTFYTKEAMERLEIDTIARCKEVLNNEKITIKSSDRRLRSQIAKNIQFVDPSPLKT